MVETYRFSQSTIQFEGTWSSSLQSQLVQAAINGNSKLSISPYLGFQTGKYARRPQLSHDFVYLVKRSEQECRI